MYDIIMGIIGHTYDVNLGFDQELVIYICGLIILILTVVFIDLIYRIFRHFWR